MTFSNKVIVITGAASGIGAAISESFSKLNASICMIDINEKNLLKVKEECEKLTQGKVFAIKADVRNDEDIKNAVHSTLKEFGRIAVLINAAGVLGAGSLLDSDIVEKFDKIIPINLRSVVSVTRKALPALIESKGCVINISSIASKVVGQNTLLYGISKAGVTNFTKSAAYELARLGVRVNCISPGPVRTNLLINAGIGEAESKDIWDDIQNKTPLNKRVEVDEVAEMAVYLASDKAASITGSDFVVDAGMMLGPAGEPNYKVPSVTGNVI